MQKGLGEIFKFRPMRQCAPDRFAFHWKRLERNEIQRRARLAAFAPPPPCLQEIEPRPETQFADSEIAAFRPTLRQPVAAHEHVTTFGPPVGARIEMVAKPLRIRHIAVEPSQFIPFKVSHCPCRQYLPRRPISP
jgi:hypothetical protein